MLQRILFAYFFCGALCAMATDYPAPRQVDERRAAQVGIRKIVGRHLRLYTDLPASDAVDSLPAVFDAAVPLWADYFQVDIEKLRNWRMQGYLIQDRSKFAALGLMPQERRNFPNGFSNGFELWLIDQPSDYFRRHLLLHEGTHGFMYTQLGSAGPGWYMEGMAELLGTHSWQDGQLRLRVIPKYRQEVPMWGRIKLVRDAAEKGQPLALSAILTLDKRRAFSTTEYSWCWSLCHFLDSHPRWQTKFRRLPRQLVDERGFNRNFRKDFQKEWPDLLAEWSAFVATLDYGYDAKQMAMQHRPASTVTGEAEMTIAADRGWQSTGWQLKAGQKYHLTAAGRYQIAKHQQPWPCEPGGVTLEYHEGRPLGMLIGAWREVASNQFSEPFAVGLSKTLQPKKQAVLYLRVNESAARLSDNQGELSTSIRRADD